MQQAAELQYRKKQPGGANVGAFPQASHTPGESSLAEVGAFPERAIPRARVPFRTDNMCILEFMYYICGLSANSQEMFSMAHGIN